MITQIAGPSMRLSTMINTKKNDIFFKHLFYSVKKEYIPQNISSEIKYKIKNISLEEGFYSQVVMITRQTEFNDTKEGLIKKMTCKST